MVQNGGSFSRAANALVLAWALALSLAACGSGSPPDKGGASSSQGGSRCVPERAGLSSARVRIQMDLSKDGQDYVYGGMTYCYTMRDVRLVTDTYEYTGALEKFDDGTYGIAYSDGTGGM